MTFELMLKLEDIRRTLHSIDQGAVALMVLLSARVIQEVWRQWSS